MDANIIWGAAKSMAFHMHSLYHRIEICLFFLFRLDSDPTIGILYLLTKYLSAPCRDPPAILAYVQLDKITCAQIFSLMKHEALSSPGDLGYCEHTIIIVHGGSSFNNHFRFSRIQEHVLQMQYHYSWPTI